jgi:transposase InsO family protein
MSIANPLWGAPRIHGELLKLGIDIGQTSVAKYMARRRDPPSQGWRTFLRNHADGIAAMDLFVVPTISFRPLYGFLIVEHGRRQILWFGVTAHPTAEWIANQITEACGWEQAPRYLIRDRDGAYGEVFIRRLRSISIRDRPTSPRSPWQNGYAERLIGSIRRECLDHVCCAQRAPPPSPAALLHEILQWGPHASIPGQRCAGLARRRSRRAHSLSPNPGWTALPIWPDLIYDRHNVLAAQEAPPKLGEIELVI